MFFLLHYSSRGGSLDISVPRSFGSAFKHWWRTFCVKTEPLTLQELVLTWHAVCTARMHYCDISFCFWCVRSVHRARRTLSAPTARTHCDLLCAASQPLFYILKLCFLSCWSRCTGGGGGGGGGGGWCCMPLHSYLGLFLHKHVCATTCKLFSLDELLYSKNTHFTKEKKRKGVISFVIITFKNDEKMSHYWWMCCNHTCPQSDTWDVIIFLWFFIRLGFTD